MTWWSEVWRRSTGGRIGALRYCREGGFYMKCAHGNGDRLHVYSFLLVLAGALLAVPCRLAAAVPVVDNGNGATNLSAWVPI